MKENRILVLSGPTASGKTAAAVALARLFPLEIVNADSMQVYRGMDIGTAKPSPAERAEVPHHLIDVADPDEEYSAGRFVAGGGGGARGMRERGAGARGGGADGGTGKRAKSELVQGRKKVPNPFPGPRGGPGGALPAHRPAGGLDVPGGPRRGGGTPSREGIRAGTEKHEGARVSARRVAPPGRGPPGAGGRAGEAGYAAVREEADHLAVGGARNGC